MAGTGYPPPGSGYPYAGGPRYSSDSQTSKAKPGGSGNPSAPPNPYAPPTSYASPYASPPPSSAPYASSAPTYAHPPPTSSAHASSAPPYGSSAPPYGSSAPPYGSSAPPYGSSAPPYGSSAPSSYGGAYPPQGGMSPFASLTPSVFPPGTDPNVIACFQVADKDRSGFIDDRELQGALSSYNQPFSMRTVHLLMYLFTGSNCRQIGPKEFSSLFYSLQNWRATFERFDRDKSGRIDTNELREALLGLGFSVSQPVLDLLISKFDKTGGHVRAIEYDNFIECCLTVKGLTEKFKEKDPSYTGSATFSYDAFMLAVLPFIIA